MPVLRWKILSVSAAPAPEQLRCRHLHHTRRLPEPRWIRGFRACRTAQDTQRCYTEHHATETPPPAASTGPSRDRRQPSRASRRLLAKSRSVFRSRRCAWHWHTSLQRWPSDGARCAFEWQRGTLAPGRALACVQAVEGRRSLRQQACAKLPLHCHLHRSPAFTHSGSPACVHELQRKAAAAAAVAAVSTGVWRRRALLQVRASQCSAATVVPVQPALEQTARPQLRLTQPQPNLE